MKRFNLANLTSIETPVKRILIVCFSSLIINLFSSILFLPFIYLNENQVLYLHSTLSQVIAGLFGLFLAGYAIVDPRLKEFGEKNKKSSELVDILRKKHFLNFVILSIVSGFSIFLNISLIILFRFLNSRFFSFLLNQTIFMSLLSIFLIFLFGSLILNPNSLNYIGEKEKEEIELDYLILKDGKVSSDNFTEFILYYNKLEMVINRIAEKLLKSKGGYSLKIRGILDALDVLNSQQIINKDILDAVNELRKYRNALVHSINNQTVNTQILKESKELHDKLELVLNNFDNNEERTKAIFDLYRFSTTIRTTPAEKAIINTIISNPIISISEIAAKLGVSKSYIARKLEELTQKEFIYNKEGKWIVVNFNSDPA